MPKPYPPEFRRRALDLFASGRTVVDVAALLGISQGVLYKWRSRELVDAGVRPGRSSEDAEELAKANRRIHELEEEVKILRKAAAAVRSQCSWPVSHRTLSSPELLVCLIQYGHRGRIRSDSA